MLQDFKVLGSRIPRSRSTVPSGSRVQDDPVLHNGPSKVPAIQGCQGGIVARLRGCKFQKLQGFTVPSSAPGIPGFRVASLQSSGVERFVQFPVSNLPGFKNE